MMNKIINASPNISLTIKTLHPEDRDLWDRFGQALPTAAFMQSWAWSDFKELEGYQVFRYGIFDRHQLVGGCLFYFYPHSGKANLLISPGGPILTADYLDIGMKLLIQQAEILGKELGAIAWRIEPQWQHKPDCLSAFVKAPVELSPSETLLIDLQPSEAQILQSMKQKGRYNLRLSWRAGVTVEFTTDSQAIPKFYELFWETVKHQEFFGEPYGFFINLCQTLFAAKMAEIGFARWQGKLLATMILVYWGDRAIYLYGGRSFAYPQVRAPSALHWGAIQRAKQRGCKIYDFYGFTRDPDHNYAKFSQFKSQFGGIPYTTIGAGDYFLYDQLADTLINLLQNLGGDRR